MQISARPHRAGRPMRLLVVAALFAGLACALAGASSAAAGIPLDLWEYEDSLVDFHGEDYAPGAYEGTWLGEGAGLVTAGGCDVTGDGVDDVIAGAPYATVGGVEEVGRVYVIPGGDREPGDYDLPAGAMVLSGDTTQAGAGTSVDCAGDVDDDGTDDIAIGQYGSAASGQWGFSAYVVFGGDLPSDGIDLANVGADGHGFEITDSTDNLWLGESVAGIGDITGDGKDDIALSDDYADRVTVIAGKADSATIELFDEPEKSVLTVVGTAADGIGAVSAAGDVDGDDVGDLLVSTPLATGPNGARSGAAYVVSGAATGEVVLADWQQEDSGVLFPIWGPWVDAVAAASLTGAGDVDGDGLGDIALGSPSNATSGSQFRNDVWVVYGKAGGGAVDLAALGSADGYTIAGRPQPNVGDGFGDAIAPLGDVNGDGGADLAIGAPNLGGASEVTAIGAAYVVYGRADGQPVDVAGLTCAQGARMEGDARFGGLGASVAATTGFTGGSATELVVGANATGAGTAGNFVRVVPLADRPGVCEAGPAEPVSFGSGQLDWGVKESFRNYIQGPIATGTYEAFDGASRNPDGTVGFDVLGGRYDPADGSGELLIDGTVAFRGHHGQLELKIANLRAELDGEQGTLFADVASRSLADGATYSYPGVALASLTIPPGGPTAIAGGVAFDSIQTLLTETGAPPFGGFYDAGTALDPLTVDALYGTPRPRPDRGGTPPGVAPTPPPAGPKPALRKPSFHSAKRAVTIARNGKAAIATLRCGAQACRVTAPKSVRVKIARKAYRVAVLAPKRLAPGRVGRLRVKLPKAARKALAGRKATVKVKVSIAAGGSKWTRTIKATLEGRRKHG